MNNESHARHLAMGASVTFCSTLCETFSRRCGKISHWCQNQMTQWHSENYQAKTNLSNN